MATKNLGLVIYGCAVAAILRSQGVASAPVQGEPTNVQAHQIADLEQQLMQQSGENKSSQPASSVNRDDPAEPQDDDALVDEAEATGLSSDYYGIPSSSEDTINDDDVTKPKRFKNQLGEDSNEDDPAAGPEEEEEPEEEYVNSDEKLLGEQVYNGRDREGYSLNIEERRPSEGDGEEIEEEENNRKFHNGDGIEQIERPWEEVSYFESRKSPPSGVTSEKAMGNELGEQEKAKERKEEPKADEDDGLKTSYNRNKLEQQKGRLLAAEFDTPDRHKDGKGLRYVDDDFTAYM